VSKTFVCRKTTHLWAGRQHQVKKQVSMLHDRGRSLANSRMAARKRIYAAWMEEKLANGAATSRRACRMHGKVQGIN
jgi:hypothetical protein